MSQELATVVGAASGPMPEELQRIAEQNQAALDEMMERVHRGEQIGPCLATTYPGMPDVVDLEEVRARFDQSPR